MIVLLGADLMLGSRLVAEAERRGVTLQVIGSADELPDPGRVERLLVDWGARETGWGAAVAEWRARDPSAVPEVLLFGPHTDREAHAAARASGLGPMKARSWLMTHLPEVIAG